MKVMCIKEPTKLCPDAIAKGIRPIVKVGETYTVIQINRDELDGVEGYELEEHIGFTYAAYLFAPLSDIDESELILERQEVKYH